MISINSIINEDPNSSSSTAPSQSLTSTNRMSINSMLGNQSSDETEAVICEDGESHTHGGKNANGNNNAEGSSASGNKTLATADELFNLFKQKLKTTVALDTLSNNKINDLKLLENEFQLLATTNGIFTNPKLVENMKNDINNFDPKIFEKISRRNRLIKNEKAELDTIKYNQLKSLVDVQAEKEYILHHLRNPDFSLSDPLPTNSYIPSDHALKLTSQLDNNSPLSNGFSPSPSLDANPSPSSLTAPPSKSSGPGRRRKKNDLPVPALSKISSESLDVTSSSSKRAKRKRKPTVRLEEMREIDSEDLENDEDTFDENDEEPQLQTKKKRKNVARHLSPLADGSNEVSGPKSLLNSSSIESQDEEINGNNGANNAKTPKIKLTLKQPRISLKEKRAIEKQYDNTYISIWKDLSRKDGPKVYRLFQQTAQAKLINLRKTSQLAARESRRWKIKTTKAQKDQATKARRFMREMLNFWKKNEKEERNLRLKAEQEALAQAKKEEEERESKRQARKLNFLINQTELYSHFIGRKIKTNEFEGDMGDKSIATDNKHDHLKIDDVDLTKATTDINSVNFDEENDEDLQKMAAANAQTALMAAKSKAEEFNSGANHVDEDEDDINEGEMNFQNPTSIGNINIEQPKLLNCTLKEYQKKGLNWLANLYEQGINGILADEMGLGKTVQSISVLAYLAETHNIWGPFLVVTPASTLHNWQQEITRFVPEFKVLPYWGTAKDRKVLRKFWDRKNIVYNKSSPFHVVVTSYQLVVADVQYFQKMKWQYMILDEAQAIKSSQSSRWKSLLNLQCRNRLLLTGTPIQNSMQELWALLHFIMPSLFDSHDEFSEWFSKDIESHAQSNTQLNEQQLRRLHAILKPFMLRRIKKNVQSELGEKIEIDVYCDLTNRQKKLYRMLRSQINLVDLIENNKRIGNNEEVESLMNVVMQFRKVCNHPDLFERADTKSAFCFSKFSQTQSLMREVNENNLELNYTTKNLIEYKLPRLIHDDILTPSFNNKIRDKDLLIKKMFNVYDPNNLKNEDDKELSFLRFVDKSSMEIDRIANNNVIVNSIDMKTYTTPEDEISKLRKEIYDEDEIKKNKSLCIIDNKVSQKLLEVKDDASKEMYMKSFQQGAFDSVLAPPIEISCSREGFKYVKDDILYNDKLRSSLQPLNLNTQSELIENNIPLKSWPKAEMSPEEISNYMSSSTIRLPSMERFVLESAKLKKLDQMLIDLKKGGHKCLIYFQMTRMMDLMEEYLTYRQYRYIRLDGSSKLSDRRDLVHDWQTKPELFIFLLSTRAGGLGINLTAADTVIFYDSDWNPTIDSQAMDRAHRLGQTRQVTVYRLLVRGTVEERMRDRAKQKEHVQQVVMEGKVAATVKNEKEEKDKEKKEIALWLLEDEDK